MLREERPSQGLEFLRESVDKCVGTLRELAGTAAKVSAYGLILALLDVIQKSGVEVCWMTLNCLESLLKEECRVELRRLNNNYQIDVLRPYALNSDFVSSLAYASLLLLKVKETTDRISHNRILEVEYEGVKTRFYSSEYVKEYSKIVGLSEAGYAILQNELYDIAKRVKAYTKVYSLTNPTPYALIYEYLNCKAYDFLKGKDLEDVLRKVRDSIAPYMKDTSTPTQA